MMGAFQEQRQKCNQQTKQSSGDLIIKLCTRIDLEEELLTKKQIEFAHAPRFRWSQS